MSRYRLSPFTEAQLYEADHGRADQIQTDQTLPALAVAPATATAIRHARSVADRPRWASIVMVSVACTGESQTTETEASAADAVWRTLPGDCCQLDALRLIAHAKLPDDE